MSVKSDIEIAREAKTKPIADVAAKIGVPSHALIPYGWTKAKVSFDYIDKIQGNKDGKLILVTAISPTPAGEGKTTTTVGLATASIASARRPSCCAARALARPLLRHEGRRRGRRLRPGRADGRHQPALHRRLPRHHQRAQSALGADRQSHLLGQRARHRQRRVNWKRVLDMNDRALRSIVNSLGGVSNGFPREDGFDITVASEVMAILCLSKDLKDLENAPRQHHRRLYARQEADPRARSQSRRRDDGAAQGRAAAEPGADARKQSRRSSTAGRSPTSPTAATRCSRRRRR